MLILPFSILHPRHSLNLIIHHYRPTHSSCLPKLLKKSNAMHKMRNHPCSVWVREDRYGFTYVTQLLSWLCEEFTYRWDKKHATETFYFDLLPEANMAKLFPHRRRSKPVPLAVSGNPTLECPVETYRAFYRTKQQRWPLQWTRREVPPWFKE